MLLIVSILKRLVATTLLHIAGKAKNFDRLFYLEQYPDVRNAGIDPAEHYLRYGLREGRLAKPEKLIWSGSFENLSPERETILIVSHEASLTGAPVLSLNLVKGFANTYNIITIILGDGPLKESFSKLSNILIGPIDLRRNPWALNGFFEKNLDKLEIKYAFVNSIESRFVLPSLANRLIPTISLLHEFSAYTRPLGAFKDAIFWSNSTVFSTKLTLQSAIKDHPELKIENSPIIPQGKCTLAQKNSIHKRDTYELELIKDKVLGKIIREEKILILGAGSVQLRKGVDLFIDCAAHMVSKRPNSNFHFVWIGKGYDPIHDANYSVYLKDQIQRSNLESTVTFLRETEEIESIYSLAKILLLTSRLDPLPNVAIDALTAGLPIVCFEKTTGISEFLEQATISNSCVASYLDTKDMAEKAINLIFSEDHYKHTSQVSKSTATKYFNMEKYIKELDQLARNVAMKNIQEKADLETVREYGDLNIEFCYPRTNDLDSSLRVYIRSWASGIGKRKPFPGFHPDVYTERHGTSIRGGDPYADYLRAGCPKGPWLQKVITPKSRTISLSNKFQGKVALHIHAYYLELFPELLNRINKNSFHPDLFISVKDSAALDLIEKYLSNYQGRVNKIEIVPNIGRDIGPFLTTFRNDICSYDLIGHMHTKESADIADKEIGKTWYEFLQDNLLGNNCNKMIDIIISHFANDSSLGLVFPDDPNVIGWGANKLFAEKLKARLKLKELPEHFNFPVGTMFWARVAALKPLWDLNLSWQDYPKEPLPYDGSLLHALERIFPLVLEKSNSYSAVTYIPGVSR
ncbi:rhamnan synthesis F family protein [Pseudomonas sp. WAC2]|uniref:rhamnan synthesis F family protein n=1 Tax=Pseudomonas sp. WAC2 TaxID=3055057 RepID=UPI0025B1906C|nr:rhamnan synthesis F family protein [Pseudomonas sp. WAC2]MDN3235205.1 rhamnan synthesis F family protein [Pseudomonas sp. WAC2]